MPEPQKLPLFLTQGVTYLLPKDPNNPQHPSKWCPTICLPTTYKVITSRIAACIDRHCDKNNIIAEQQKGCRKGAQGCKEQLTIDAVVCNQVVKKCCDLYSMYNVHRLQESL